MKRKVSLGSDRALLPSLPKERKQRSEPVAELKAIADGRGSHSCNAGGIEDVLVDKELMFLIFGPDLFAWKDLPMLASVCRYPLPHHQQLHTHNTSASQRRLSATHAT
jgi:hypothetical protein